jgi:hypothetical protein
LPVSFAKGKFLNARLEKIPVTAVRRMKNAAFARRERQ